MSWICPACERELGSPNQWHHCAKVSIDSLFTVKRKSLLSASATKNCVVFVHNQTFLVIRPMKNQLDLKFYS